LAKNLIGLLNIYGFKNKIIMYVKKEGSNLKTFTSALKFIVKCEALDLKESFQGTYFEHVFFKSCQYVINNEKKYKGFKYVFTKYV
jgi:hypothetical protein